MRQTIRKITKEILGVKGLSFNIRAFTCTMPCIRLLNNKYCKGHMLVCNNLFKMKEVHFFCCLEAVTDRCLSFSILFLTGDLIFR